MENANRVQIANLKLVEADKEYNWAIPHGCQWFTMQSRTGAAIRIAVTSGLVADKHPPYFTVKTDNSWDERQLKVDLRKGLDLFFASSTAGEVLEVLLGVTDGGVGNASE